MNIVEKARLIKELNELIHALDYRALSLFETAKYKQRIREIFELCDEGYFKKQILQYRALTQPDRAAHQFAKTTAYSFSYRGFFYQDTDLEQALYLLPESGWALLYGGKKGWQCWLIPAPHRTALISEWCPLEDTYTWLEEQQNIYACLASDEELKSKAAVLKTSQATVSVKAQPRVATTTVNTQEQVATARGASVKNTQSDMPLVANTELHIPEKFKWLEHQLIWQDNPLKQSTLQPYRFKSQLDGSEYFNCYVQLPIDQHSLNSPVFLIEQLTQQGAFHKYAIFLGLNSEDAVAAIQTYHQALNLKIGAIKSAQWQTCWPALSDLNTLYSYYESLKETCWQAEDYLPFIPHHFIHTQKFLHFDEAKANYSTPLLLLKERDKIRIVHGQQRMRLSSHELAYPYLMLHREHGLSWQQIKQAVSQLPTPIHVQDLYAALVQTEP